MAIQAQFYSDNLGFCLGASQDSLMENSCGFDFTPQQQQRFYNFPNHKNLNNAQFNHHHQSIPFSAYIDKQRHEFEQFLNLQNERLKLALEEQRKQQEALLIKKYESKTRFLLTQKDGEIAKALNRRRELENFLKKIDMENQAWQRAARENEAMVASLNGLIQRARESGCLSENAAAEDAQSCCDEEDEGENGKLMMCKRCNSRNSCVVMLPCRHMSCCPDCEVFLDSCPVCRMPKKASIEALI
ncbi:hypothetical protein ACS0TY_001603 [Phlomoides rotata]